MVTETVDAFREIELCFSETIPGACCVPAGGRENGFRSLPADCQGKSYSDIRSAFELIDERMSNL